ncbi:glycoside hydrolase superfamily [Suillus spraguei]|nr:glycoside hydrolase superfamily [Suillus spraguei]
MLSIFSVLPLALCSVSASKLTAKSTPSPVIGGWYTTWHATESHPAPKISWEKYNTMYYAFVNTTSSVDSLSLDGTDGNLLPQFVSDAQSHGVEAHVAVGGWLGSVWFSSNIATSESRTAFVKTLTDFVHKYKLDGIQFDWEYPGKQGVGCNKISVDDTSNYLQFLQELRKNTAGANLKLSAAVSLEPFTDASGKPSADVSGFAQVLDYITLMNYDVWGPSSTHVGPNAPLNDTCASPENRQGSAVSAIKSWTAAGMPIHKIVLGVASYGHSFSVSPSAAFDSDAKTPDVLGTNTRGEPGRKTLAAYPAFDASKQPLGDAWDDTSSVDVCGVRHGPGGTFRFWGLVDAGFLKKDGTPADGIDFRYDECSQTPYAYNEISQVMISFDNPQSFAAKGKFIKETGLGGFTMREVAGDYNDILLDSITEAIGGQTLHIPVPAPTPVTPPSIPIPVQHVPKPVPNRTPNVVPNAVPNEVRKDKDKEPDEISNEIVNQVQNENPNQIQNENPNQVQTEYTNQVQNEIPNQVQNEIPNQVQTENPNQVQTEYTNQVQNENTNQVQNEPPQVQTENPNQVQTEYTNQVQNENTNQVQNEPPQVQTEIPNQVQNEIPNQVQNEIPNQVQNEPPQVQNEQPNAPNTDGDSHKCVKNILEHHKISEGLDCILSDIHF